MLLRRLALLTLLPTAASAGSVLLVDPAAGPFFEIQPAIDAAADGDVVLVRTGDYPAFVVVSREVAIVADAGETVRIVGAVRIRDTAAGQTVVLAGLRAQGVGDTTTGTFGLRATGCAGSVRVLDCELSGRVGAVCANYPWYGMPSGARLQDCADFAFSRTSLAGTASGGGTYTGGDQDRAGSGLEVLNSRVVTDRVFAYGAPGYSCPDGAAGGMGARIQGASEVFTLHSTLRGGAGGSNFQPPLGHGGNGGNGAFVVACPSSAVLRSLGSSYLGGDAGLGNCRSNCQGVEYDGLAGAPVQLEGCATHVALAGVAPSITCATVVRENSSLALILTGMPGDRIWLRTSRATGHAYDAARKGVHLLPNTFGESLLVAEIGPSGQAAYAYPIGALPPTDQARVMHLQVTAQRADGTIQLGSARSVAIVDSTF